MKKIILQIIGIVAIALLFQSCAHDVYENTSERTITVKPITFDEFSSRPEAFNKWVLLQQKQAEYRNSRVIEDTIYNFYVSTEVGKYIEKNGYESFTFPVFKPGDERIHNLLLSKKADGQFQVVLVRYDYTKQELETLSKEELAARQVTFTELVLNERSSEMSLLCVSFWEYQSYPSDEGELTGHYGNEGHWVVVATYCSWAGGGGGGSSGGEGSGPGNGGGNNGGGGSGSGGIITVPVKSDPTLLAVESFTNSLSVAQLAWWNNTTEGYGIKKAIMEYAVQPDSDYAFAQSLIDMVSQQQSFDEVDVQALQMAIIAQENGYFNQAFDSEYYTLIDAYTDVELGDPITMAQWAAQFSAQCAFFRLQHPEWSTLRVYWEASKEMIHLGLDLAGMAPVIGEVADLANGVIYTVEGDGLNATLSYASAIPVAGWFSTGAKMAMKTVNITPTTRTVLKWFKNGNSITFGNRSQLRKILKLAVGDPRQAHHIIPWGLSNHPAIQKAAKSEHFFHMNEALNGIPLSQAVHNGSHAHYNGEVLNMLNDISATTTPEEAYNQVLLVIMQIRTVIHNNPGIPINQLNF